MNAVPAIPNIHNVPTTGGERPFPMITLYGQAGVGKTTLAAEFPRPFLINVEGGVPAGIDIPFTGVQPIRDYDYLIGWIEELMYKEHPYKTVIIDSLDTLEKKVIHPHVCARNDFDSVDTTFGRAYTRSSEVMEKILDKLEYLRIVKKMFVVLTSAAVQEQFDDLVNNSYHRYNLGLQRQLNTKIFHQSDFMFFMQPEVYMVKEDGSKVARPSSSSRRQICTSLMPTYVAKSRATGVPNVIYYEVGSGFQALRQHFVNFITGKSQIQEVDVPLQVSDGQTVAEARKQTEEEAKAKAFANSIHAGTATASVVPVKQHVDPSDDAGNTAHAEQHTNLSADLDDEIPF